MSCILKFSSLLIYNFTVYIILKKLVCKVLILNHPCTLVVVFKYLPQWAKQIPRKTRWEFHNKLKTPGFSDLFHDIHDPVIHGNKGIMEIRFALEKKWNDPNKASKFCSFNPSVNATVNKIAS